MYVCNVMCYIVLYCNVLFSVVRRNLYMDDGVAQGTSHTDKGVYSSILCNIVLYYTILCCIVAG